jgi:transcriptional regulator with XRE-family HTH domain
MKEITKPYHPRETLSTQEIVMNGAALKFLRRHLDMNQYEMAFKLDISQAQISRYETDKDKIPADVEEQIFKIFDYAIDTALERFTDYDKLMKRIQDMRKQQREMMASILTTDRSIERAERRLRDLIYFKKRVQST